MMNLRWFCGQQIVDHLKKKLVVISPKLWQFLTFKNISGISGANFEKRYTLLKQLRFRNFFNKILHLSGASFEVSIFEF
jgi:hypothetical protein